jgi:hypothetical protein
MIGTGLVRRSEGPDGGAVERNDLLDDRVTVELVDYALDLEPLVARSDEEHLRSSTDGLVLEQLQHDPVRTAHVAALADVLGLAVGSCVGEGAQAIVDLAEDDLVAGEPLSGKRYGTPFVASAEAGSGDRSNAASTRAEKRRRDRKRRMGAPDPPSVAPFYETATPRASRA